MHRAEDPGDERLLAIGEVAEHTGLTPSALRFYETRGLVAPTTRVGGKRRYHPRVLSDLALVDAATRAGFTLAETRELLEGLNGTRSRSQHWETLAARKWQELEETIQQARTMQRLLRDGPFSVRRAGGRWGYPSPFAYQRGPGLSQASLLFDTLLWNDPGGRLVPWLAESWTVSRDATVYRFVLREGVRWSDGAPLSADDVAFTFAYLTRGPGRSAGVSHTRGLASVEAVTAIDERTVEFRLPRPYAPFLDWVAGRMLIVPRHVWQDVADPESLRTPDALIGTGPYRLEVSDEEAGHYRFGARDAYLFGAPYVRRLEFLPVRDSLEALEAGEIDVAEFIGDAARPTRAQLTAFERPDYVVSTHPGEWTRALHVNLARGTPYRDRRFRHALAHALDRPTLIAALFDGLAAPAPPGGLAPSHPDADPDPPAYGHDPDRAAALLDECGLDGRDARGRRCLPHGEPLQPELLTETDDPGAGRLVAASLQAAGVDVRLTRAPRAVVEQRTAAADYDLALVPHGSLGGDPDLLRLQLARDACDPTRARVHGYHDAEFERLADEQRTCTDPVRRRRLVVELQRLVARDLPIVPTYVPTRVQVVSRRPVFNAWRFTPGGVLGGFPGSLNKQALVTGTAGRA